MITKLAKGAPERERKRREKAASEKSWFWGMLGWDSDSEDELEDDTNEEGEAVITEIQTKYIPFYHAPMLYKHCDAPCIGDTAVCFLGCLMTGA